MAKATSESINWIVSCLISIVTVCTQFAWLRKMGYTPSVYWASKPKKARGLSSMKRTLSLFGFILK
ncbi:MAG: hypothetical protein HC817_09000 [Saprospiraceae bacterium]|nr:hypothetical protein [Saprospiraceae bacterium]